MKPLVAGVLLLVGVTLIHRGLHKPRPVWTMFDMAKWAKATFPPLPLADGLSNSVVYGFNHLDGGDGDQGGWPTHDGGAA
jgi:hypothetical protein